MTINTVFPCCHDRENRNMTINILNLKTDTDIQGWDVLAHRVDKKNLLDKKMYWKRCTGAVVTEMG